MDVAALQRDSLRIMGRPFIDNPATVAAGGVAFPFVMLFEWWWPLFELLGYVVMTALWLSGSRERRHGNQPDSCNINPPRINNL